jgi:hypothetical protein
LVKGAKAVAETAGAAVSNAAQSLAQAVLDRLRTDPAEERTVERYERDPATQQPAIEAAIADVVATDETFASQLEELVAAYEQAKATSGGVGVEVHGNVAGSIQAGDHGILLDRTSGGDIRIGRDPDQK